MTEKYSTAMCYLERGAEADAELEEQEGDDRPHENGLRAPWLCCLRTPPIAWDRGRLTHPQQTSATRRSLKALHNRSATNVITTTTGTTESQSHVLATALQCLLIEKEGGGWDRLMWSAWGPVSGRDHVSSCWDASSISLLNLWTQFCWLLAALLLPTWEEGSSFKTWARPKCS